MSHLWYNYAYAGMFFDHNVTTHFTPHAITERAMKGALRAPVPAP
jgi:hypothetical protein